MPASGSTVICVQTPVLPLKTTSSFFPRLAAELTRLRNRVEAPDHLAGANVERAGQTLRVVGRLDGHAFLERRADEHHVVHDGRCRVQADLASLQIDLLARAVNDAFLEVDDAVAAEAGDRLAGLGVERHET